MDKSFIFFCIACALLVFSIITICIAPVINGGLIGCGWGQNENCKKYADYHKLYEKKTYSDSTLKEKHLEFFKKGKNLCNRNKAMYGLEYASFISDLILGFICALLSLLHYFGIGKNFEKITGIIGFTSGTIGFIITLVYIIYSGYIFTKDGPHKFYHINQFLSSNELNPYLYGTEKMDKNRVVAEWDDSNSRYNCIYYKNEEDYDSFYIKYKDIGKKQYNYHKDFYFAESDSDYINCKVEHFNFANCKTHSIVTPTNMKKNGCKKLYYEPGTGISNSISNKYSYDKWVTTIIFGCFIIALNLGLAIFGFLLFMAGGTSDL